MKELKYLLAIHRQDSTNMIIVSEGKPACMAELEVSEEANLSVKCGAAALACRPRRRRTSARQADTMRAPPAYVNAAGPVSYQSLFKLDKKELTQKPNGSLPPLGLEEPALVPRQVSPNSLPAPNAELRMTNLKRSMSTNKSVIRRQKSSSEAEGSSQVIDTPPTPMRRGRSRSAGTVGLDRAETIHGSTCSGVTFHHDGVSTNSMEQIAYLLPPGASAEVSYYEAGEPHRGTVHIDERGNAIITPFDHSKRVIVTADLLPRLKMRRFSALSCVPRIYRG